MAFFPLFLLPNFQLGHDFYLKKFKILKPNVEFWDNYEKTSFHFSIQTIVSNPKRKNLRMTYFYIFSSHSIDQKL